MKWYTKSGIVIIERNFFLMNIIIERIRIWNRLVTYFIVRNLESPKKLLFELMLLAIELLSL